MRGWDPRGTGDIVLVDTARAGWQWMQLELAFLPWYPMIPSRTYDRIVETFHPSGDECSFRRKRGDSDRLSALSRRAGARLRLPTCHDF